MTEPIKSFVTTIIEFSRGEWSFVGTHAGMKPFQHAIVRRAMIMGHPMVFRHGGTFGAETEAHAIWREVCSEPSAADVWPSDAKRADLFSHGLRVHVQAIMSAHDRHAEIVKRSALLIAAPHKEYEVLKSETWQTIRIALQLNKPVLIIWPQSQRLTLHYQKALYRVSTDNRK